MFVTLNKTPFLHNLDEDVVNFFFRLMQSQNKLLSPYQLKANAHLSKLTLNYVAVLKYFLRNFK